MSSKDRIRSEFGETGLTDYAEAYGRLGAITDDTQMTLFTAEGLILSKVRQKYAGEQLPVLPEKRKNGDNGPLATPLMLWGNSPPNLKP